MGDMMTHGSRAGCLLREILLGYSLGTDRRSTNLRKPETQSHHIPRPRAIPPKLRTQGIQGRVVRKNSKIKYIWKTLCTMYLCVLLRKLPVAVKRPPVKKLSWTQTSQIYLTIWKISVFFFKNKLYFTKKNILKYCFSILIQLCTWNSATLAIKPIRGADELFW